jgi:mono/diheme cytochrome c family protein
MKGASGNMRRVTPRRSRPRQRRGHGFRPLLQLGLGLLLAGCGNMKKQEYARTEEPRAELPRGTTAQLPPAYTVPHRPEPPDAVVATGERAGRLVADIPVEVTAALVARGRERFDIYCAVCHGPDGYGHGIVVQRGFPAPPSYHDPRLRNAPAGYFFRVITQGHGLMYSYADRLAVADRWAVVAYVRALQLSQHARFADLADSDRSRLSPP